VAVILEAVDAALRIFLHVTAGDRIAVVVRVLLALTVTAAVVCGIVGRVHAMLARSRLFMPWVPGAR
jgi:hypothetical protein